MSRSLVFICLLFVGDAIFAETGKEHGAFYLPDDGWIKPLLAWIEGGEDD